MYSDWEKAYTAVLEEAEKTGFASIALPALGTGKRFFIVVVIVMFIAVVIILIVVMFLLSPSQVTASSIIVE